MAVAPMLATISGATALTTVATVVDATPAAAAINQPLGIDVSNYQHPNGSPIDWSAVHGAGVAFTFIKATEGPVSCTGSLYTNPYFRSDWAASRAAGLYRGAYHFARPGDVTSALTQARQFAAVVGPMNGSMDLPPVLDLEVTCGQSAATISAWSHTWIDEVYRLTGRHAIITTYPAFWSGSMAGDTSFASVPLWIATYGPAPIVPPAWPYWTFWQSSSSGTIAGINYLVDIDHFCCGDAGLARLAADQEHDPFGWVDEVTPGLGTVRVSGWDLDLDSFSSIDTHVYVDGIGRANVKANLSRPDIAALWPAWGDKHGFSATIGPLTGGRHTVCVYGISVGPGSNALLACRTVDVPSPDPNGNLEQVTNGIRTVTASGWTLDPDTTASNEAVATVDGVEVARTLASSNRPDVSSALSLGAAHGFSFALTLPTGGPHRFCVIGTNIAGYGADATIGCRDLNLPTGSPFGAIDDVHAEPGLVRAAGWTIDPDTASSIPLQVVVDGVPRTITANASRPDLPASYPAYGPAHGFTTTVGGLAPGPHTVCLTGVESAGVGANTLLGCRSVIVPGGAPIGFVDSVTAGPRLVHVRGWTLDPNTAASIPTHVYVDGVGKAFTAGTPRPDVASFFVGFGPAHGIDVVYGGLAPGTHTVCVYGIDVAGGDPNTLLSCQAVTVPGGSPFGVVDSMTGGAGSVRVTGWAIDPDTVSSIPIHVYIDGIGKIFAAAAPRPDVAAIYPDWGVAHGIDLIYTGLSPGAHTVCVYAINAAGAGVNPVLSCRTVTTT